MSNLDPTQDRELIAEFVTESNEGLANIEARLLSIEQDPSANIDIINAVFRTVHSIKGTAGFLELRVIEALAHSLEQVLNHVRNDELRLGTSDTSTMLQCVDRLRRLIDDVDHSNDCEVEAERSQLNEICSRATSCAAATSHGPSTESAKSTLETSPAAVESTGEIETEAMREFIIECQENLDRIDRDLLALEHEPGAESILGSLFRSLHTIKGSSGFLGFSKLESVAHAGENLLGRLRDGMPCDGTQVANSMLALVDAVRHILVEVETSGHEGGGDYSRLIEQLRKLQMDGKSVAALSSDLKPVATPQTATPKPNSPAVPQVEDRKQAAPAVKAESEGETRHGAVSESTIRVDVGLLDRLMNQVGELVLARNQILQHVAKQADAVFSNTAQRLNLITTELQEGVMKTRMQPIGNVWSKFPRVVRDLALQLGKQVRIEMKGKETELDKTIIEAIKDPLIHLVRNSVDHGIEKPSDRVAAGKQAEGCLTLRAFHEGGQVNIEICDDGAGLKLQRIREHALKQQLITPEQATRMSEKELARLIFAPGFSTAEKVTNVSGRGVGMDVVRTNIEKIGGSIDLQSEPGRGTTIKIKIPLTLAIIPALLVTSDGDRFAIPQASLLELVRLEQEAAAKLEQLQGALVYRLRGRLLPLIRLRSVLKIAAADQETTVTHDSAAVNIVVVRADEHEFGLIVDRINDTEEIVVKPLAKQLKGVPIYAGATIMGDGQVALILDVTGIGRRSRIVAPAHESARRQQREVKQRECSEVQANQSLLVFLAGGRRLALPMSAVTRLEKIDLSEVETSDQQQVVQYRNQIMPLVKLADLLGITATDTGNGPLDVIVHDDGERAIGLVVQKVIDIVEAALQVTRKSKSEGLLGSAVIQGLVTDLLDMAWIERHVHSPFGAVSPLATE